MAEMPAPHGPDSRRLIEKLIREILRSEADVVDHPGREAKRIGEAPPVVALQEVANHASAMRTRLHAVLSANEIPMNKGSRGATLATLRHLVVDRVTDPERAFRTALLDLRHGIEIVVLLRDVTRRVELFGLIRWCDDWLGARRTVVARVEAQLVWFTAQESRASGTPPTSSPAPEPTPTSPRSWHTDRTT